MTTTLPAYGLSAAALASGRVTAFEPKESATAPSFSTTVASMKFIWGDPMKPATNRLQGSLYSLDGVSTCCITPSFITTMRVPSVMASVWSCVT